MNFFRELVSGPKQRYLENGFNLDLTYVTNRVIAMAYPASGVEKLYRNSIDNVVDFINKYHKNTYMIINLSNRYYDYSKFENKVIDFKWEDHHSPPIHTLFLICQQIDSFLKENNQNVIFVHCLAGKGRTGTIICCYLMYSGRVNSPQEAMHYYSVKRFKKKGLGVNQPCQTRYIHYFWELLQKKQINANRTYIKSITLKGRPNFGENGGCKPYFDIISVGKRELIHTTKNYEIQRFEKPQELKQILFEEKKTLIGDVLLQIKNQGMINSEKMAYVSFNTSFINDMDKDSQKKNKIALKLKDLSPYATFKNKKFPKSFQIEIEFGKLCQCDSSMAYSKKCSDCQRDLAIENSFWDTTHQYIKKYKRPKLDQSIYLLFGNEKQEDDVDRILEDFKGQNDYNPEQMEVYIGDLRKRSSEYIMSQLQSPQQQKNNNNTGKFNFMFIQKNLSIDVNNNLDQEYVENQGDFQYQHELQGNENDINMDNNAIRPKHYSIYNNSNLSPNSQNIMQCQMQKKSSFYFLDPNNNVMSQIPQNRQRNQSDISSVRERAKIVYDVDQSHYEESVRERNTSTQYNIRSRTMIINNLNIQEINQFNQNNGNVDNNTQYTQNNKNYSINNINSTKNNMESVNNYMQQKENQMQQQQLQEQQQQLQQHNNDVNNNLNMCDLSSGHLSGRRVSEMRDSEYKQHHNMEQYQFKRNIHSWDSLDSDQYGDVENIEYHDISIQTPPVFQQNQQRKEGLYKSNPYI